MKIKIMKEKKRKEMEQDNIDNMFSEEEREVAQVLVELPRVILDLKSPLLSSLPFTWGCKRIRSAIQDTPSTTTTCAAAPAAPPLYHGGGHGGAAVSPPCEAASSPATPLSLSLTESDDKAKNPLRWKASLERKKEYYLKSIEDSTKSKASLNEEIENVKHYNEQLKAFNLKLKARKQELCYRYSSNKSEAKKPNLGIGWPMQLVFAPVNSPNSMAENHQHQQLQLQVPNSIQYVALMLNQTCGPSQICNTEGIAQFQYVPGHHPTTSLPMSSLSSSSPNSSSSALGLVNNTSRNSGPIGILDLNLSSEELIHVDSCQQLDVNVVNKDLNREISAQARQRRIQINKLKNPIANSKTRYYG